MGEFYGANLFLAESSATSGGLDSLLEPTGNIKKAQDAAARAFGADRVFFVTNGTSTSNKMVHQALLEPGDIVIADRNCHKSHHYGMVLAGAQPYYVEAFPMVAYSMYGAVPLRSIKKALLDLKAAGRLDKVKMVTLTNCTFDGHVYDVRRVMEECLAIKPDLIFLWDEAWFGFARFSPLYRPRTAMGARADLKEAFADPAYLERYLAQEKQLGADLDPKDARVLDTRLIPDPRKAKLRIYQTNSTHKSMSALRQGSMVLVADEDYHRHEQAFKEAVFTHASTSPNQQIIASLDVARRQMELEGYGLVMQAIQLAIEIRSAVNTHPLVSKYFRVLDVEDMVPAEFRQSGLKSYIGGRRHLGGCGSRLPRGRVHPRPDPAHAAVRDRRLRRHAVQEPARRRVRDPAQQDLAQLDPAADQHQQHAQRRGEPAQGARRDLARRSRQRLKSGGEEARKAFAARVKSLVEDVPDLPNFSHFHDRFRDDPQGTTLEGDMRSAFYMAYDHDGCEHVKLMSPEIDKRLASGPPLVSAHFVIPYPPGFPIMVPGQVIKADTIEFMRKLDVKEIHGYDANLGLKLISPAVLEERSKPKSKPEERAKAKAASRGGRQLVSATNNRCA